MVDNKTNLNKTIIIHSRHLLLWLPIFIVHSVFVWTYFVYKQCYIDIFKIVYQGIDFKSLGDVLDLIVINFAFFNTECTPELKHIGLAPITGNFNYTMVTVQLDFWLPKVKSDNACDVFIGKNITLLERCRGAERKAFAQNRFRCNAKRKRLRFYHMWWQH